MQNAALRHAGLPLHYEALDVPPGALAETMRRAREESWAGNVTVPHKVAVAQLCDSLSHEARIAGAVNTFWAKSGSLHGDNTDVAGFDRACTAFGTTKRAAVVACLGAGGGAAAVCAAVSGWPGATVRVLARRHEAALSLAARFSGSVSAFATPERWLEGASLVVNCTPIGLAGDELPLLVHLLPGDVDVMDLSYRIGETPFIHAARARGLRATDGLDMLIQQGALAFERWCSQPPDLDVMRNAVRSTDAKP